MKYPIEECLVEARACSIRLEAANAVATAMGAARRDMRRLAWGLEVGREVEAVDGEHAGKRGIFIALDRILPDRPAIIVQLLKKDGTPAKASTVFTAWLHVSELDETEDGS